MNRTFRFTLCAAALIAAGATGVAAAQAGLSSERAGLGVKPGTPAPEPLVFGVNAVPAWQAGRAADYSLYAGGREQPRLGINETGSYGGIVQPLTGSLGSSLEAGYVQESLLAPRRYVLTGQLHSELRDGRALSLGLQYRVYDGDFGSRAGVPGDLSYLNGYSLASSRFSGAGYSPSYQLQFSYQHSPASVFGLAFGRDVETYTPYLESAGQRQLTFTGQHWLTQSWALSYDVLTYDLASSLRPQNLRLGLGMRYRF
jgi:hypothetical protein